MNDIAHNLAQVRDKISAAATRCGRSPEEITLLAVSKTKPVEMLSEIYDEGIREFGENKVQEMCEKMEVMPKDIHWHMIGHLQTNKVKYIVGKTSLIHSVDSLHLAKEIQKQAIKHDCSCDILVEVNIAGEASKFGTSRDEAISLVEEIAKLDHIHIKGLMTIAPFVDDPEDNRQYFRDIKQLSVDIAQKNIDNVSMNVLSMGMTGDYTVAIEEGATMVREYLESATTARLTDTLHMLYTK